MNLEEDTVRRPPPTTHTHTHTRMPRPRACPTSCAASRRAPTAMPPLRRCEHTRAPTPLPSPATMVGAAHRLHTILFWEGGGAGGAAAGCGGCGWILVWQSIRVLRSRGVGGLRTSDGAGRWAVWGSCATEGGNSHGLVCQQTGRHSNVLLHLCLLTFIPTRACFLVPTLQTGLMAWTPSHLTSSTRCVPPCFGQPCT